ncbi:hypothetical protein, partial [Phosphitispora fastidiosa]|uniref:hypothetical protein n=1 Tax=Phosphitispora fastidiosa TaxID=2837202 RepID=UPI001E45E3CA
IFHVIASPQLYFILTKLCPANRVWVSIHSLKSQPHKKDKLISWIYKCENYYGGFQMNIGRSEENDSDPLFSTYCALFMLSKLSGE